MQVEKKTIIIVSLVLFALGWGSGYFTKPTEVKIKTVEVIKTQTIKEEAKNKIVYKERTVYKDGTIKEIEKTEDSSHTKDIAISDKQISIDKTVKNDIGFHAAIFVESPLNKIGQNQVYGVHLSKRIFSNISIGIIADTNKSVGISVGLDF
jgi:hypothetical protein